MTHWSGTELEQLYLDISTTIYPSGLPQRELTMSLSIAKQIVSARRSQHRVARDGTEDPTYS